MKKTKALYLLALILLSLYVYSRARTFKDEQLRYPRVREAFKNSEGKIDSLFSAIELSYPPEKIFIRIFKFERLLELWAKADNSKKYKLVEKYRMTAFSGNLGPKREEGDLQIPEGFYHIDRFNPASNYHLSLRLNYPNKSDSIRKQGEKAGGDIFIHGSNVTIGCIPLGNPGIEKLYAIAVDAKSNGQSEIPVHIFPFKMNSEVADSLFSEIEVDNGKVIRFWKELTPVFEYFEAHREIPEIDVGSDGSYTIVNDK